MPDGTSRAPLFHGWVVVGGVFGVLFVSFGSAYSFAAFFTALRDEFEATRGDVSLVFALTGFLYFGLGAVSGTIADRVGPRRVILAGIGLTAAGMALASLAQTVWQVYLTYSLGVGLGVGLAYVPAVGGGDNGGSTGGGGFASGLAVAASEHGGRSSCRWVAAGWDRVDLAGDRRTCCLRLPSSRSGSPRRGRLHLRQRPAACIPMETA